MISKTFVYIKIDNLTEQHIDFRIKTIRDYCLENKILLKDDNILIDKSNDGKQIKMDSPQALKNLSINSGDTLIINELNQLGKTSEDIGKVWQSLYVHGVDVIVIDNKIFNTYNKSSIEKKLKSEIIIELLNYIRGNMDIINIANTNKNPSTSGRPKEDIDTLSELQLELLRENFDKFDRDRRDRLITADQFMSVLGLKRNTFYKIIKQYKEIVGE